MFQLGDKVFYPMHGAGVIDAIEEKEVLGKLSLYYIMHMKLGDIHMMVPVGQTSPLGIREVVKLDTLENALLIFDQASSDENINYSQRLRINNNRMKTGDVHELAHVIRDLFRMSLKKSLGTADKQMLHNARSIFISEIAQVKDIVEEDAAKLLDETIACSTENLLN